MAGRPNIPQLFSKNRKTVSYSRASTLMTCPLLHHMIYDLGMRIPKEVVGITMGSKGHAVLEEYYNSNQKMSYKQAQASFATKWEQAKKDKEAVKDKRSSFEKNDALGQSLVAEYLKFHKDVMNNSKDFHVLKYKYPGQTKTKPAVELPFRVPIVDLDTGQVIINGYDLIGFIDVIESVDGLNVVLDHKFAALKYKDFIIKNDFQVVFYTYVMRYLIHQEVFPELSPDKKHNIESGYNFVLKPYRGPDWNNRRSVPEVMRMTRKISNDEINGVLHILKDYIYNYEHGIPTPIYSDNCDWRCDLHGPCKAHRLGLDKTEAFEKEFGFKPSKKWISRQTNTDVLF